MFYNTLEKFDFWGVLNVNRLRVAPEKLSTIGPRNCGKLLPSYPTLWDNNALYLHPECTGNATILGTHKGCPYDRNNRVDRPRPYDGNNRAGSPAPTNTIITGQADPAPKH